jgi:glutaredoxin
MIKVSLIRPWGCGHCMAVKAMLERMKGNYDLVIEEIEATSAHGQELIQKHGILSSPGILINDQFFAMGGATEAQLRAKFDELKK